MKFIKLFESAISDYTNEKLANLIIIYRKKHPKKAIMSAEASRLFDIPMSEMDNYNKVLEHIRNTKASKLELFIEEYYVKMEMETSEDYDIISDVFFDFWPGVKIVIWPVVEKNIYKVSISNISKSDVPNIFRRILTSVYKRIEPTNYAISKFEYDLSYNRILIEIE